MSNNNLQLQSRCNPYGITPNTGLIGQIYFVTDSDTLDARDQTTMNTLRPFSMFFLGGQRIHMWCKGYADHRWRVTYNQDLGQRRANTVQQHLNRMFRNAYFTSSAISLGEDLAYAPQPSETEMASDRRVDIFVNRIPDRPPIRLPNQHIFGRIPPEIQIEEVFNTITAPQQLDISLEGALSQANKASVESRIQEELDRLRSIISFRMINHSRGGILVVAVIKVVTRGGQSAGEVVGVFDHTGIYKTAQDGIGHWRSHPGLIHTNDVPPFEHTELRYFWATRSRN